MEVKKDGLKAEPQKAKMPNNKGKEFGAKEDDVMKPVEKKDKETKEKQEEDRGIDDAQKNKQEEKNERKIIGKIVKASAGQKAKVQMKTVIGGVMKAAEVEEGKKNTEPGTKGRGSLEEKNAERSAEIEGKSNKVKTANVPRKEKLTTVEKHKRMRHGYEGEHKRQEKDSATSSGKKNENKAGNEAMSVKEDEKKGKAERDLQLKEERKAEDKVQTQSEGAGCKGARLQTSVLDRTSDNTSAPTSETEQEQPDGCGNEEEEETDEEKKGDSSDGEKVKRQRKGSSVTLTDSTLHRIHGDIRISLKTDNPVRALFTLCPLTYTLSNYSVSLCSVQHFFLLILYVKCLFMSDSESHQVPYNFFT